MSFKQLCEKLEAKIVNSYEQGVSLEDAEKLAGEFLFAMFAASPELKKAELDRRMRKTGVKAIRANIYMDTATKSDKKPSDSYIDNVVNLNEIVQKEQDALDEAEADFAALERYYDIFLNAHIHYRGLAKGSFNG